MGIHILSCLLFYGISVEINVQPLFLTFISIHLVMDSASRIILINSLLHNVSGYQVLHQTTLQFCNIFVNSIRFCNIFRNSIRCIYVKCWHCFILLYLNLTFSYLASKITHNCLLEMRNFPIHVFILCNNS